MTLAILSSTSASLTWATPQFQYGVMLFNVLYSAAGSANVTAASNLAASTTAYTVSGLLPYVMYNFYVVAFTAGGATPLSRTGRTLQDCECSAWANSILAQVLIVECVQMLCGDRLR